MQNVWEVVALTESCIIDCLSETLTLKTIAWLRLCVMCSISDKSSSSSFFNNLTSECPGTTNVEHLIM